jgi:hypothetical protein
MSTNKDLAGLRPMEFTSATIFIVVVLGAIFIGDLVARRWRENEWQRRWKNRDPED